MVVEADPPTATIFGGKQRFHVRKVSYRAGRLRTSMDADCAVDIIVFSQSATVFFEAFIIGCHIDDRNDALCGSMEPEQLVTVDVELLAVVMRGNQIS